MGNVIGLVLVMNDSATYKDIIFCTSKYMKIIRDNGNVVSFSPYFFLSKPLIHNGLIL